MIKKTKIVATISDSMCDVDFLKELYNNGMNVVRLNTAHQTPDDSLKVIENVRRVSDKIPILVDTKGPEIRTTEVSEPVEVKKGDVIYFCGKTSKSDKDICIQTNYEYFVDDIPLGSKLLIDDGELCFSVKDKVNNKLKCEAENQGKIKNKKSINIPGVEINLPALNKKDKKYIRFAIDNKLEFIAHSFVRNANDLIEIQKLLDENKSDIKLIAKIENQAGVDNIDEILDHAYGVMVARGDLGIEIPAEKIPSIQSFLIKKCRERKKAVIIATQMLHSMIDNPRPTRAEVTDIANAVYRETDAIMLSGETAYGKYPLEAVKMMTKIAVEVESTKEYTKGLKSQSDYDKIAVFLADMAAKASRKLPVKAIILDSMTGRAARYMSAIRNKQPVITICYNKSVMRELALSYGIEAIYYPERLSTEQFKLKTAEHLINEKIVDKDDLIVIVSGSFGPVQRASFVEINSPFSIINHAKQVALQ